MKNKIKKHISATGHTTVNTPGERLIPTIARALKQPEREILSERIKAALQARAKRSKGMKAVIYSRTATVGKTRNSSLDTQEKVCVDYCLRCGLEVDRIFREKVASGNAAGRTELKKLLSYCRKYRGYIKAVLVHNLSRLSRNAADYFAIRALLARDGINLISVTEATGETAVDKLIGTVISAIAQYHPVARGRI